MQCHLTFLLNMQHHLTLLELNQYMFRIDDGELKQLFLKCGITIDLVFKKPPLFCHRKSFPSQHTTSSIHFVIRLL